jgi:hypothetical protein
MIAFCMHNSKGYGLDRVRHVLSMQVADAVDLEKFSESIADFSAEELVRLANALPTYCGEWFRGGFVMRTGARRSDP